MIPRVRGMFWVAIQILLLLAWFLLLMLDRPLDTGDAPRYLLEGAGTVLAVAGLALAIAGVHDLGANLTPSPEPRRSGSIVASGIYRRARHPIYGGIMLMVVGITLIVLTPLGLLFLPAIFTFFYSKSNYEERRLRERFPNYEDYAASAKRFIPFIW